MKAQRSPVDAVVAQGPPSAGVRGNTWPKVDVPGAERDLRSATMRGCCRKCSIPLSFSIGTVKGLGQPDWLCLLLHRSEAAASPRHDVDEIPLP